MGDNRLGIFLQSGGTPGGMSTYNTEDSPDSLAVSDFNGDLRDDIAVSHANSIFLQSGGTLGGMSTYNTEDSPDSLAVGDFNGDLRDDIAVSHANSQSLALYHQEEDGTFAEPISHSLRSGGFNVLASGDLNGDGYDDLVLLRGAGASEEQLAIFYQEAGGLTEPIVRTVDDDTSLSYGLAVSDMTGDGRDDIVVSAGGNSAHASLNLFVQQIELLEVQFKALAPTDATSLLSARVVRLTFAEGTDVTFGGYSVLGEQASGSIVISSPTSVTMSRLSGSSPSPLWALLPLALTILAGAFISRR